MTIAHLSDTHLGFRAYGRLAPGGYNQREVDVMNTFLHCLEAIRERDPDLVVHAGDLFHVVRPSNATIVRTYRAILEFQEARNHCPFVIIGGNHDTPRTVESGNILTLFRSINGVFLAPRNAERFEVPELDVEVLTIPSNALTSRQMPPLEPEGKAAKSVLVLHGMARQALPEHSDFDVAEADHERWTYVALGDYHSFQAYGRNVGYAGSTDFTSSNIWDEIGVPKGWVWFDEERGMELVPLETRRVLDLPSIDARDIGAETLEAEMQARATWPEGELPIVRQRIFNLHPAVRAKLDYRVLREIASRALNYQIRATPPERTASRTGAGRPASVTLEQSWQEHVDNVALPREIDRDRLKTMGTDLLKEVAEREARPTEA